MTAKKQKPKAGKVVRLSPPIWKIVSEERLPKETIDATLRRLFNLPKRKSRKGKDTRIFYILPEARLVFHSLSEARGMAVLQSVQKRQKDIEVPIAVREVI